MPRDVGHRPIGADHRRSMVLRIAGLFVLLSGLSAAEVELSTPVDGGPPPPVTA